MPEFVTIASTSDIPAGSGKIFDVKGNSVAVWNLSGNFHAFQNVCPHRGGPVGEGELEGNVITCPWHGWSFDVVSGTNTMNPAAKINKYDVKVENNQIQVAV
jgi:nitrite reductase/ring-hydroxylating ferredoxin subunit